ncbi:MAG: hypothetical protein M3132_14175 [Actinomycetia bacterium]|nr:hypothetical protein [Actinomycetes bacterium]
MFSVSANGEGWRGVSTHIWDARDLGGLLAGIPGGFVATTEVRASLKAKYRVEEFTTNSVVEQIQRQMVSLQATLDKLAEMTHRNEAEPSEIDGEEEVIDGEYS